MSVNTTMLEYESLVSLTTTVNTFIAGTNELYVTLLGSGNFALYFGDILLISAAKYSTVYNTIMGIRLGLDMTKKSE